MPLSGRRYAHRRIAVLDRHWRFFFLCIILVLLPLSQLRSQPQGAPYSALIYFGGGYISNSSTAAINAYNGSTLCGTFTTGSGNGLGIGAFYESPLSPRWGLTFGSSARDLNSRFITAPFTVEHSFDLGTSDTVRIDRSREYAAAMNGYSIDLGAAYHPFEYCSISASLGLLYIPQSTYTQIERLLSPNVVYLENFRSSRVVAVGRLSINSVNAIASLQIGYDLKLSPVIALRPNVAAWAPVLPIATIDGTAYRTYSISASLGLVYYVPLVPSAPEFEQRTLREHEVVKPAEPAPPLRIAVKAVGLSDRDEEIPEPVVAIENILVTDVSPTLAYLFFDDGAASIPSRYTIYKTEGEAQHFSTKEFYKLDAFSINHELLNVIGKRLQEHPDISITITGTRSTHSAGDSLAGVSISQQRAEAVATYLKTIWGIRSSRIKIRSRALPELNSDDGTPTGQGENRRVEISTTSRELLAPIETQRLEQTATPPRIKFDQDIYSRNGIKTNKITISQGGRILQTIDGLSGESHHEWLWNIAQGAALGSNDSVIWKMEVEDSSGQRASISGSIRLKAQEHTVMTHRVDSTIADKLLERFHLLLFDYSSTSELGRNADDILTTVANSITPDATVTLIGHTDITGDPAYNDKLSYDRASKASVLLANKLKFLGRSIPELEIEGRGSKDILYDNSVPEGRMLSRTVRVTVERTAK